MSQKPAKPRAKNKNTKKTGQKAGGKQRSRSRVAPPRRPKSTAVRVASAPSAEGNGTGAELIFLPPFVVPRAERLRVAIPVVYRSRGTTEWRSSRSTDISRSGVALEVTELLAVGTYLEMVFEMPQELRGGSNHGRALCRGYVARGEEAKSGSSFIIGVTIFSSTYLQDNEMPELPNRLRAFFATP